MAANSAPRRRPSGSSRTAEVLRPRPVTALLALVLFAAIPVRASLAWEQVRIERTVRPLQTELEVTFAFRNTGTAPLTGPFTVTITNLPQGAALANAAGSTFQGSYILSNSTTLAPGAFLSLPVSFTNPSNLTINYSARAYSGSF